jgi:hypothetical protein
VDKVTKLDAAATTPFVGEALRQLRTYIGDQVRSTQTRALRWRMGAAACAMVLCGLRLAGELVRTVWSARPKQRSPAKGWQSAGFAARGPALDLSCPASGVCSP